MQEDNEEVCISISNLIKFTPLKKNGMSHIWEKSHTFNASEIFRVILEAGKKNTSIKEIYFPMRLGYSYELNFALLNQDSFALLTKKEVKNLLTRKESSLKVFLKQQNLSTIQTIYNFWKSQNPSADKRRFSTKAHFISEILTQPKFLADSTFAREFLQKTLIFIEDSLQVDKGFGFFCDGEYNNGPGQYVCFKLQPIQKFSSKGYTQFWEIYNLNSGKQKKSLEFFTNGTISFLKTDRCILNIKETEKAKAILHQFIQRNQSSQRSFFIAPYSYPIALSDLSSDLSIEEKQETDTFELKCPNDLRKLKNQFGVARKSKFETLKCGLSLLDKLEPTKKLIKLFAGKNIVLNSASLGNFHLGIPLQKQVLEALILHSKIEYFDVGKNLLFCRIVEQQTDEALICLWQKIEEQKRYNLSLTGYQLSE